MKNAHLRFGWLTYYKRTDKTTTTFKLRLDRFIGEVLPEAPRRGKAHLISVVGGDTQIAAVNAAISMDENFQIEGPGLEAIHVSLGRNAQTSRASLQLSDRKKPLRHLIGISEGPDKQHWQHGPYDPCALAARISVDIYSPNLRTSRNAGVGGLVLSAT